MTLEEFYLSMGSSLDEVLERLVKRESVEKFLKKFYNSEMYCDLIVNLENKDYEEAFRNVHSIKGVCLNLGLTRLLKTSEILCEALRDGKPNVDIQPLFDAFVEDYEVTMNAIEKIDF